MAKIITLGEVMLRFSTKEGERLGTANTLATHFGGGEANVVVSLANFGHEVYFDTKIPENALGQGVLHPLKRYGVLTDYVLGGGHRLGTYYVESGIGERASQVLYDRAEFSFAQMKKMSGKTKQCLMIKTLFISQTLHQH
jgi:2-dehydro-3-deoxygluconokinase